MIPISNKLINDCRANPDGQKWYKIIENYTLSESFMREFKDKIDWYWIIVYQKLSEEFIRDFKAMLCWDNISTYQKLSKSFMREFNDKINWIMYTDNPYVIPSVVYTKKLITKNTVYHKDHIKVIKRYYTQQMTKRTFKNTLPKECIKMITSYL